MRHRVSPRGVEYARVLAALGVFALVLLLVPGASGLDSAAAQEEEEEPEVQAPEPPPVPAEAWALADAESGRYLAGENADEQRPLASINKIMLALVVLESGTDLDEEIVITATAEEFVGTTFSNVGLIRGEVVTVRDLLVAALVPSGTEAAYALAESLGGGNVDNFVNQMNQMAAELDLENTSFADPAGLDDDENYSSPRDLAMIAREALEYPEFVEIVDTQEASISTQNREIDFFTTNELLNFYPPANGVKTGTSPEAGASLVSSAESEGESYIAVVLNAESSEDRFSSSQALLDYGFRIFEQETLVSPEEVYGEREIPYRRGETVELAAAEEVSSTVSPASEVERRVADGGELPPEAEAGDRLGEVEVFVDGESVGSSPLVAVEGYEEASFLNRIWYSVSGLLE
ncbi:MAG: D-alanyl-D-alanine carboxypeptidase [Rubrobacter sp.]|nr:D-alanyl-D-alanine carboxypeptidase [Rubrobacter sp.]